MGGGEGDWAQPLVHDDKLENFVGVNIFDLFSRFRSLKIYIRTLVL